MISFSHKTKGRRACTWLVCLSSWCISDSHLRLLALTLHQLRLHLLQPDLLLLLFIQVGHWLKAATASGTCTTHSPESSRHGRLGPTSGWVDIDTATFILICCFRCWVFFRTQIYQVNELGTLDPGIVSVLVLRHVSLRSFSRFLLRDSPKRT